MYVFTVHMDGVSILLRNPNNDLIVCTNSLHSAISYRTKIQELFDASTTGLKGARTGEVWYTGLSDKMKRQLDSESELWWLP